MMIWSWVLTSVGATAIFTGARKPLIGWGIGLCLSQPLWLAYALATRQWGFLVSVAVYGYVFASNFRKAWRERTPVPTKEKVKL